MCTFTKLTVDFVWVEYNMENAEIQAFCKAVCLSNCELEKVHFLKWEVF